MKKDDFSNVAHMKPELYTLAIYYSSEFSYTKTERTRHTGGQSLPVSITSVGCYSSDERLIDCAHHDFPMASTSSTSMDVSISCHQSSEQQRTSSSSSDNEQLRRVSTASLTVAVICVIAVVFMVALLIIVFVLRRRGKYNPR